MKRIETILYLRTDVMAERMIAGGSVAHTLGVIKGFMSQGVAILCASSCMIDQLASLGIKELIVLKNPTIFSFLRWRINCMLSNLFFTCTILKFLFTNKIDAIYQRYSILNCSGIIVSFLKKIPLILEYNGSDAWIDKNWSKKKLMRLTWLIKLIERINIHYATYIVVVSDVLKEELIARGVATSKILVNPNGVDPAYFDPAKLIHERTAVRKYYTIENKFVFGFVGTFSLWHGISVIEYMIIEIAKIRSNVHFLLIGDGPLRKNLEERLMHNAEAWKSVTFVGLVEQHKTREYLAAADAFLCPTQPNPDGSRFFGSPTKLFEYMSMGKPIIASDLEQVGQVISPACKDDFKGDSETMQQVCGFLVQPDVPTQFVNAALQLMAFDEKVLKNIGKNARNHSFSFTWNQHSIKILNFLG